MGIEEPSTDGGFGDVVSEGSSYLSVNHLYGYGILERVPIDCSLKERQPRANREVTMLERGREGSGCARAKWRQHRMHSTRNY